MQLKNARACCAQEMQIEANETISPTQQMAQRVSQLYSLAFSVTFGGPLKIQRSVPVQGDHEDDRDLRRYRKGYMRTTGCGDYYRNDPVRTCCPNTS